MTLNPLVMQIVTRLKCTMPRLQMLVAMDARQMRTLALLMLPRQLIPCNPSVFISRVWERVDAYTPRVDYEYRHSAGLDSSLNLTSESHPIEFFDLFLTPTDRKPLPTSKCVACNKNRQRKKTR